MDKAAVKAWLALYEQTVTQASPPGLQAPPRKTIFIILYPNWV
jgi:hypothetical protein